MVPRSVGRRHCIPVADLPSDDRKPPGSHPKPSDAGPQAVDPADVIDIAQAHGGDRPAAVVVPAPSALPYADWNYCPATLGGATDPDDPNVRMYFVDGVAYNHPVGQAQVAINCLGAYASTGLSWQLDRAMDNAQRLIDTAQVSRGAWFFPYDFDWTIGNPTNVMRAPWFSAMAQGQALTVFSRLWQMTKDSKWLDAARATAPSLTLAPTADEPFVSYLDPDGYLWLDEYARWPVSQGLKVLNGDMYSSWGLYDYWRITGDAEYLPFLGAALETVAHYVATSYRDVANISFYCLFLHNQIISYHLGHIQQFNRIYAFTGDPRWAEFADWLEADYPPTASTAWISFSDGPVTLYQLDDAGAVTATRIVTFAKPSGAPADRRQRIAGSIGIGDRLSAGAFVGWWVTENPYAPFVATASGSITYNAARTFTIAAGVCYRLPIRFRRKGDRDQDPARSVRPRARTTARAR